MFVGEILQTLQTVPHPLQIFPCPDTPYSKYSISNYAAADWELPAIREIISERKARLVDIDVILEQLDTMVKQFREQREKIASSIKAYGSIVSGIRRLPLEILKEIFLQCLPEQTLVTSDAKAAPLLLTGICRGWRDVALNTPWLWCSVLVEGPKERLPRYHDWLKNAKGCPLSLKIDTCSSNFSPSGWNRAAMDFLQQHAGRLISLSVDSDEVTVLDSLLRDVPRLERLYLTGSMNSLFAHPLSMTQQQTCLRSLVIQPPFLRMEHLLSFDPGWHNLTRLAVVPVRHECHISSPIFLLLLRTCPNLEHFVFSPTGIPVHRGDHPWTPISLTHPNLRLLKITDCCDGWADLIGHTSIVLPNLDYFYLLYVGDYEPIEPEDVFTPEIRLYKSKDHRILNLKLSPADYSLFDIFNLGWKTLTHIRADVGGSANILIPFAVLDVCPNVQDLVVSSIEIDEEAEDDLEYREFQDMPIIHNTLPSLRIEILNGVYYKLLDLMTFAGLRHLDLELPVVPEWPHASFKAFLSRSRCPLETLRIAGPRISSEERGEITSLVPTLRHVEIEERLAEVSCS